MTLTDLKVKNFLDNCKINNNDVTQRKIMNIVCLFIIPNINGRFNHWLSWEFFSGTFPNGWGMMPVDFGDVLTGICSLLPED